MTSLAVCSHARRLGIASSLLRQLHYHLHECHDAGSVGLHVRISNEAAVRLYCTEGYGVADIMPLYYGDGEGVAGFPSPSRVASALCDEFPTPPLMKTFPPSHISLS